MDARYESRYFIAEDPCVVSRSSSDNYLHLAARAAVLVEGDPSTICEIWDRVKACLVLVIKRTYSD